MSPPIARLEVVAGKAAGMSIVVEDELLIGRHADGAGRLADDAEISRTHARVTLDGAGFCAIEDLGSTNGTFLNGLRISSPQTLSEGDAIEVGGTTLVIRELPARAAGQPGRPVTTRRTSLQRPAVAGGERAKPSGGPEPARKPAPAEKAADPQTEVQRRGRTPPPLSLRLKVDFAAREATITLSEGSEAVKLVFEGGVWRPAERRSEQP